MKWNETWDYNTRKPYWWTQRNENGICFEIRKNGAKFNLFVCDMFLKQFDLLQEAMDIAEKITVDQKLVPYNKEATEAQLKFYDQIIKK